MALMVTEVYDALRAANVPDEKARQAAAALAGYEPRLGRIEQRVAVLTWMVATNIGLSITMLAALGGIYLRLFDIAARLPR